MRNCTQWIRKTTIVSVGLCTVGIVMLSIAKRANYYQEGLLVMNDAIVLWALLLLYGIPIATVACWMEKKAREGGGDDN
jgi:hypothetical protein